MTARPAQSCNQAPTRSAAAAFIAAAGIATAGMMLPTAAQAQMPPDIAAKIAALGRVVDPENTGKLYAPLQEKEPYDGIKVSRDVKYGPDARNVVDIFTPETGAAGRPVLMFVHGGGYVRGNKHALGSPYYDNIMVFAARHGMVGVNVEYRLAPAAPWPAGVEDMGAAVRFVDDKIANYGGDPNRVFLMGHSAGAGHVAAYVSHPEFFGPKGSGLAGAIFSSGPSYVLKPDDRSESTLAYFGADPSRYAQQQALPGLLKTDIPFMFSSAELDPPAIAAQSALLKEALCKSEHGCVRSIVLPHHSHMSESYAIGTADTQLSDQILDLIKAGK
jgi:pimeloyl-ACP methyl ester carboxylesterase